VNTNDKTICSCRTGFLGKLCSKIMSMMRIKRNCWWVGDGQRRLPWESNILKKIFRVNYEYTGKEHSRCKGPEAPWA
jgi:hypothetical protein